MNTFTFQIVWKLLAMSLLVAACAFGSAANATDYGGGTILYGGADAREKGQYYYGGLIHNFSGNVLSDGFLVKFSGINSRYDYSPPAVVGGNVNGDAALINAMVGYQKALKSYTLRGYLGLDFENHLLTPDTVVDQNQGSHFGVKVQGEFETNFSSPLYVNVMSAYGSAVGRYWGQARVGYDFNGYVIGPEARVLGDPTYNDMRFGSFLTFRNILPFMATISGGASDSGGSSGSGARVGVVPYVATELSITF